MVHAETQKLFEKAPTSKVAGLTSPAEGMSNISKYPGHLPDFACYDGNPRNQGLVGVDGACVNKTLIWPQRKTSKQKRCVDLGNATQSQKNRKNPFSCSLFLATIRFGSVLPSILRESTRMGGQEPFIALPIPPTSREDLRLDEHLECFHAAQSPPPRPYTQ
ncbi:uncharacterized protein TNCV_3748771 [Trichonephila clavipes]|nr:uncharacterized protein TNCV_3748771 [Trichonephila clavipes]